jgi:hypothetical protein
VNLFTVEGRAASRSDRRSREPDERSPPPSVALAGGRFVASVRGRAAEKNGRVGRPFLSGVDRPDQLTVMLIVNVETRLLGFEVTVSVRTPVPVVVPEVTVKEN